MNGLRPERFAQCRCHEVLELHFELMGRLLPRPQDDEAHQDLALELIGDSDGGRFGDRVMADEHRFDLCRSQALARDLDGVVGAAEDVPETVFRVDIRPVAMHPYVWKAVPVSLEIAFAVTPESARHPR